MTIKQLSIFVENKPGRLAEITEELARAQVDIRAVSVSDTTHFGILRIIVDDPDRAHEALKAAGFTVSLTDVIAIGVTDEPGGLAKVVRLLSDEGISVEYVYAFLSRDKLGAYVILRVEDNEKTLELLRRHQVPVLGDKDISEL